MSHKAWIITVQKSGEKPEVVEHINARRKIAQIEEYLCNLYGDLLENDSPDEDIVLDEAALQSCLTRVSGTQVRFDKEPYALTAELVQEAA